LSEKDTETHTTTILFQKDIAEPRALKRIFETKRDTVSPFKHSEKDIAEPRAPKRTPARGFHS
jgi:hypothetical protein